jgi:hypothetical protein
MAKTLFVHAVGGLGTPHRAREVAGGAERSYASVFMSTLAMLTSLASLPRPPFFRLVIVFSSSAFIQIQMRSSEDSQAALAEAVNVAAFFLTNSCILSGPWPVSVSTSSDIRS